MENIIAQGAEAKIILEKNIVTKSRVPKSYRLPILDSRIKKLRTRSEAKIIEKANKLIPTPKIISVDEIQGKIKLDFIDGKKLSEHLDHLKEKLSIINSAGKQTAILHNNNIIHGDLTTSNMIFHQKKVYFIDFGLSFISSKMEDKAVDLHLINEALEAKHFKFADKLKKSFMEGYKSESKDFQKILERLKAVERRGRYKEKY